MRYNRAVTGSALYAAWDAASRTGMAMYVYPVHAGWTVEPVAPPFVDYYEVRSDRTATLVEKDAITGVWTQTTRRLLVA